ICSSQSSFIELVINRLPTKSLLRSRRPWSVLLGPESMGIRFLEMVPDDKNRLSQVILSLLVGQSANLQLFS
ncbi:MAG TPA: hypothetical protein VN647_02710, partial [Nitrospira sp.]|nr:hypothetical protein [Nitrospira sp.]